jgi:hypothetical protein
MQIQHQSAISRIGHSRSITNNSLSFIARRRNNYWKSCLFRTDRPEIQLEQAAKSGSNIKFRTVRNYGGHIRDKLQLRRDRQCRKFSIRRNILNQRYRLATGIKDKRVWYKPRKTTVIAFKPNWNLPSSFAWKIHTNTVFLPFGTGRNRQLNITSDVGMLNTFWVEHFCPWMEPINCSSKRNQRKIRIDSSPTYLRRNWNKTQNLWVYSSEAASLRDQDLVRKWHPPTKHRQGNNSNKWSQQRRGWKLTSVMNNQEMPNLQFDRGGNLGQM